MKYYEVLITSNELDKTVGMLTFSTMEAYIGELIEPFKPSPTNFRVHEIGINDIAASEALCKHSGETIKCTKGDTLLYVLCKENISTIDSISIIKRAYKGRIEASYAGLKDTSAHTCQFITIKCLTNTELKSEIKMRFGSRGLYACFVDRSSVVIRRGYLKGNYFIVRLRIKGTRYEPVIKERIMSIIDKPLINYFGYQRFGSIRPYTHIIGKLILESRFDDALTYIVGRPTSRESRNAYIARKLFEEGKLKEALEVMPKDLTLERFVIRMLLNGLSPESVIRKLNRKIIKIFIEGFQAYILNLSLSKLHLMMGDTENVMNVCEVLPYPSLNLCTGDLCSKVVLKTLEEEINVKSIDNYYRRFLRRGTRESTLIVNNLSLKLENSSLILKFALPPSAYATIVLRELLRDKLMV